MNKKDILEKAIKKAKYVPAALEGLSFDKIKIDVSDNRVMFSLILNKDKAVPIVEASIFGIIFSHVFAKGYWGNGDVGDCLQCGASCDSDWDAMDEVIEKATCAKCGENIGRPSWKHYLKVMVLEEDPVLYLEQFLK